MGSDWIVWGLETPTGSEVTKTEYLIGINTCEHHQSLFSVMILCLFMGLHLCVNQCLGVCVSMFLCLFMSIVCTSPSVIG